MRKREDGRKLCCNSESVLFTPWYWYGFRFAIFGTLDMGFISSSDQVPAWNYPIFRIGLGLRTSNDHLVFKNIQFSVNYYSTSPSDNFWRFSFTTREPQLFRAVHVSAPAIFEYR